MLNSCRQLCIQQGINVYVANATSNRNKLVVCRHLHCTVKGTVSPDIGLHFNVWKIKLVLYAGLLMVLTFFYFVVPEMFKNLYLNCFYENTY